MRKRKDETTTKTTEKFLDVNASMQGTLRFDDPVNLRINGRFEGTLDTKGVLMVGNKADVRANITGEIISVAGTVSGNIKATKALRLESTAKLTGDIETPTLAIDEDAILNGRIAMQPKSNTSSSNQAKSTTTNRGDWMTTDQLAKYLEVDEGKIAEWAKSDRLPATKEGGEWMFDRMKVDQWIAEGKVK